MDKILKQIVDGKFKHDPIPTKKLAFVFALRKKITDEQRRQQWYKIEKVIKKGHKVQLHKKSKLSARRTYEYYNIDKGNWVRPSLRQLGKMYESEFQEYKAQRIKVRDQCWLDFLLSEDVEVEGPTSSSGGNMLESENSNHVTESRDQFLPIMWESDGGLDHVTNESY